MDQQPSPENGVPAAELPLQDVHVKTALPDYEMNHRYGDVFKSTPTSVLEAEFWTAFGGSEQQQYSPEQQLLLAVLAQAYDDLGGHKGMPLRALDHTHYSDTGRWVSGAHRWFTETDYVTLEGVKERGFSLEFVCEALNLTISIIRKLALKKWDEEEKKDHVSKRPYLRR